MKFGLENMSRLCAALGHPERSFRSILIAGTNGKGSVTAMVHHALVAEGHHAARYVSPHLERLEERFVVGSREVSRETVLAAAEVVRGAIDRLQQTEAIEGPPTFFECATAIAFEIFRSAGVRIAVLEVGLGGRLDATNIVTPLAAAITSVDLDHQAQLGDTVEAIAYEKAGIVRAGIPVVCGTVPPAAERVIEEVCAARSARLVRAAACVDVREVTGGAPLALRGAHQRENAAVAACLLREIDALGVRVDDASIRAGLTEVVWPGRLERFTCRGAEVLLDAAHNPAGARALAAHLRETGWSGVDLVFGVLQDKDAAAMLAELSSACRSIVCTTPATPRALPAASLMDVAVRVAGATWSVSAVPDPAAALACAAGRSARVVVAGSIFLIGPLRGILRAS